MSLRAAASDAAVSGQDPAAVPAHVPAHVGVIMDGNGRWATSRKLPRLEGHRRGVEALRRCVRAAREVGIRFLTIYAFSAENFNRVFRLARAGYEIATVDSGQQACGLLEEAQARNRESVPPPGTRRSPYDLVILDMILNEDLDGLQVLEKIRKLYPEQRALLVSGHAPSYRLEVAVSKGLAWLAKPYTNDALLKAVHAALSAGG